MTDIFHSQIINYNQFLINNLLFPTVDNNQFLKKYLILPDHKEIVS